MTENKYCQIVNIQILLYMCLQTTDNKMI